MKYLTHLQIYFKKLFFLKLFIFPLILVGQMNNWVLPDKEIDFTVTPPAVSSIPITTTGLYKVSNAAHDENGDLLFYIIDWTVYNPLGTEVGTLNDAYFSGTNYYSQDILTEIALFPLPGSCDTWCVFYLMNRVPDGVALAMTEITIGNLGNIIVQELHPSKSGIKEYGSNSGGLALSPPTGGSYANRDLYVVAGDATSNITVVDRYSFSNPGLQSPVNVATIGDLMDITEVDLSHDGSILA